MTQREKKRIDAYLEQAMNGVKQYVCEGGRAPISAMCVSYGGIYFKVMCPYCYEISGYIVYEKKSEVKCLHCQEEFKVDWSEM